MNKEVNKRPILTEYFRRGKKVWTTHSSDPNRAYKNCSGHMAVNEYGATVAQISHEETGELFTEVRRYISGDIKTTFKRDPRDFVTKSTLAYFRRKMRRVS